MNESNLIAEETKKSEQLAAVKQYDMSSGIHYSKYSLKRR